MTTTDHMSATASDELPIRPERRLLPVSLAIVGSLLAGLVTTLGLALVVFTGGSEPVITGAALVGFGTGWALLAATTIRWTDEPQRWAAVPAAAMGATGLALLVARPGNGLLGAAAWVWPPAALGLAVWMVSAARRDTTRRVRWLVFPVIGVVAAVAVAGAVTTVGLALDDDQYPVQGALHDVGGHRLFLDCSGTGSPTVVLENGLGETAPLWAAVATEVSRTTRVCSYDRAGQGRSDDLAVPQDGRAVAADLHALLARAGEHGPYVLAGHSSGGTLAMVYAARYPAQVAGLALLDSSSPHQFTDQPDFAGQYAMMRRLLPLMPALARVGATRLLIPASAAPALPPEAAADVRAFAVSPRGARNMRDEHAQLRRVFLQAQALATFDPKPLAVVTAGENAERIKGWSAAQDDMAALSTNSTHWAADTSHVGLLAGAGSADSVRAITAVVTAVRTGAPVATS